MPTQLQSEALAIAESELVHLRDQFPILKQEVGGQPLAYFDSAASAQRPERVIEAEARFYRTDYSNVHRGVHALSVRATEAFEAARAQIAAHLGAASPEEIVFVRGTTEAINLVAQSYARSVLQPGDEILATVLEHHSNLVPWQLIAAERGARVRPVAVDAAGNLELEHLQAALTERTRIVALTHISNAIGTVTPVRELCDAAHAAGAVVVLDGAQSVPHRAVDVGRLGCDFFAFSGHKAYGPSGIGALWGRPELLEAMPPWQGGGGMIEHVAFGGTTFAPPPARFEAGTPNIAGAVGLGEALRFLAEVGLERIAAHEEALLRRAESGLLAIEGVRVVGSPRERAGILSFVVDGIHAHDVGTLLDQLGVAVRVGHHCAQPLMDHFGVAATARASFALFNTEAEVERLLAAVANAIEVFR